MQHTYRSTWDKHINVCLDTRFNCFLAMWDRNSNKWLYYDHAHQFNYSHWGNSFFIPPSFFSPFSPFIHSSHVFPLSPLHADPGGVEDAHQSQYPLQYISDDIRGHAEGSDFRQSFGLDVSNCTLCFINQRLEGSNDKKIDMYRGKDVLSTVDMASIKTVEASYMYVCQFYVHMYVFFM